MSIRHAVVVGLCGVTCSGKTSLTKMIADHFQCERMVMDDYFLDESDPRHVLVPELNHLNWELPTSLDLDKMYNDACGIIKRMEVDGYKNNIFIMEGFLVLNVDKLSSLCQVRIFVDLCFEDCMKRRKSRVYNPPDVAGYFEQVVWPESQKNKVAILSSIKDLVVLDGTSSLEHNKNTIVKIIDKFREMSV